MKQINKDTDYAIKALVHIAKNSKRFSVTELGEKLDIPRPFLRKILQILNKESILDSQKGKEGGFHLAATAENIYLKDFFRISQGPVKLKECIFNKKTCPDIKTYPLRKKIMEIERTVISELESITLAHLIEEESALRVSTVS